MNLLPASSLLCKLLRPLSIPDVNISALKDEKLVPTVDVTDPLFNKTTEHFSKPRVILGGSAVSSRWVDGD